MHVPASVIEVYRNTWPWSDFGSIVAIEEELEKCATPTITYTSGKVKFSCETEDVEFVSTIYCTRGQEQTGAEVALGATYTISVYARREGYLDSDVATKIITWSSVGDVNGDEQVTIADVTALVNIILGK